jgi:hypothetical protein
MRDWALSCGSGFYVHKCLHTTPKSALMHPFTNIFQC